MTFTPSNKMDYRTQIDNLEALIKSAVKILIENNFMIFTDQSTASRITTNMSVDPYTERISITVRIAYDVVDLTFMQCNEHLEDNGFIVDDISVSKRQIRIWYHRNLPKTE